jgi:hexosaminidase
MKAKNPKSTGVTGLADGDLPPLVPWPREIAFLGGGWQAPRELAVHGNLDASLGVHQIARLVAKELEDAGFVLTSEEEAPRLHLQLISENDAAAHPSKDETYTLTIRDGIVIQATAPRGLFWGTRTALQLLAEGPGRRLPQLRITDGPAFGYRGLLIDVAREFHNLDFHRRMIKALASYKLNVYHLHFSDDQSYTLPSKAFPELPTPGCHYSREEIAELCRVAEAHQVTLVPEIDVPGHVGALTRALPGFWCDHAQEPPGVLCLGNEATYEMLETLFAEVMEMLPGPYWHLGADEVRYQAYQGCSRCASRMAELGLTDIHGLYNRFINRMNAFVKAQGRQMFVWEGFRPDSEPTVDQDIVVFPFDVKFEGMMPDDYLEGGYRLINTAWSPLYVAGISMTTPEDMARWTPDLFGAGRAPTPPKYWHRLADVSQILGGQVCSWANEEEAEWGLLLGEGPGFPEYGRPGPRLPIAAERLWTGGKKSFPDLLERVGAAYW